MGSATPPRHVMTMRGRIGLGSLAALTAAFLAVALPPYLGLDPARARLPIPPGYDWYYPVLVLHIFCGSVALAAGCLQVWPWLRRQRPRAHRVSGRIYLFAGVLPAGIGSVAIAPLSTFGPNVRVASVMLGLLWLATSIAGYRAARRRRYTEHREWMIRSVALAFVIVANRVWVPVCVMVFAPGSVPGRTVPDPAAFDQAAGVAAWMGLLVNLLVAEWWLHRSRHRSRHRTRIGRAERAVEVPAAAG